MRSSVFKILSPLLSFVLPSLSVLGGEAVVPLVWETKISDGLAKARAGGRLVLVDFWREGCSWCVRMEQGTFADERVDRLLRELVPVKAKNADHPAEIKRYGVDGYPTLALLEPGGEPVDVHTGYMGADEFLAWLAAARDHHARIGAFKERLKADPKDLAALLGLGKILSNDGKREEARSCFEEVLRADPERKRRESAEAHLEIGLTWRRTRDYDRSLEALSRARAIAISILEASRGSGEGSGRKDRPSKEAQGTRSDGMAGIDLLDRILHELATTQLLLGKRDALARTLEEYDAKVSPPDPRRHAWVLLQLGQTQRKLGNIEAARRAFRRCDELYPRSSEARECREEIRNLKS